MSNVPLGKNTAIAVGLGAGARTALNTVSNAGRTRTFDNRPRGGGGGQGGIVPGQFVTEGATWSCDADPDDDAVMRTLFAARCGVAITEAGGAEMVASAVMQTLTLTLSTDGSMTWSATVAVDGLWT